MSFSRLVVPFKNILPAALYKGIPNLKQIGFKLATLQFGFFRWHYPKVVTFDDVQKHKEYVGLGKYDLCSLTSSQEIAKNFGRDSNQNHNFITIDPNHFADEILDVNQFYACHSRNLARGRLESEQEYLPKKGGVLYLSIKSFNLGKEVIENPFFIEPSKNVSELYTVYHRILENKFNKQVFDEQADLLNFSNQLLKCYQSVLNNPFQLTLKNFREKYSTFSQIFLLANPHLTSTSLSFFSEQSEPTLGELLTKHSPNAFLHHPYTKAIIERDTRNDNGFEPSYSAPQFD